MSENNGNWKAFYESLSKRFVSLEEVCRLQENTIADLKQNLENADRAVQINKQILHNALTDYNRKEQEYVELINKFKVKLAELGYGDLDFLGN